MQGTDVDLPLIRSWPMQRRRVLHAAGRRDRRRRSPCSAASCAISCSAPDVDPVGQIIRITQPAVHGRRRDGEQGPVGHGPGPGRRDLRALHDGDEEAARHHEHPAGDRVGGVGAATRRASADSIATLLRTRHKIQPGDPDDFMVRTMEEMASVRKEATQTMTALLASIAGVSLLVGGIGIMNIMLVSVTERTREIGLRMAIGARGRDVLLQFLVEAVVLSLFGGGIGIALGFGAGAGRDVLAGMADGRLAECGGRRVRVRGDDRRLLRFLSGAEGGRAGSDRRAAIRMMLIPESVRSRVVCASALARRLASRRPPARAAKPCRRRPRRRRPRRRPGRRGAGRRPPSVAAESDAARRHASSARSMPRPPSRSARRSPAS